MRADEPIPGPGDVSAALIAFANDLLGINDLTRVVQLATDRATALTGAQFGAFFYNVVDRQGESYMLYTLSGVDPKHFANFPMPRNTDVFAPTFRGDGTVRSDDIRRDPRYGHMAPYHGMPKGHLPVASYLAVPVHSRTREVLGGLFFGHAETGRFNARHEAVAEGIAVLAAGAIDNARLFDQLRASEERQTFLVALDDATRPLQASTDVMRTSARLLGEHLGVNRCAYADVEPDEDTFNLSGDYNAGVDSIVGRYRFADFGDEVLRLMRAGEPYVVDDVANDPRTADVRDIYAATRIAAVICVPVLKEGRFVAAMAVHQAQPRRWRAHEVTLVQRVAARSWESLERIRITRVLADSELRFRTLVTANASVVWTTDADGAMVDDNAQWSRYTGQSYAALSGWGWLDALHPDDRDRTAAVWREALSSRQAYETHYRLRHADGAYRQVLARGAPVVAGDGVVREWIGTCTDVEAERTAFATMTMLKAAVESANDSVVITDADLDDPGPRIAYVNQAFERLTGYRADEVIGRTPRLLQGPTTDRDLMVRLRRDLRERQGFEGETWNYRKDGSRYRVEWRITPLRDADGSVRQWVAIQRDVTDRAEAEARREALLAHERDARAESERVGRLKDEFLATLSHELRTPLNAILGWTQILRRMQPTEADRVRALEIIERNARMQTQLIEDLLDVSRIIGGKLQLDVRALDLGAVIDEAVASMQPAADARGVAIDIAREPVRGVVRGDPARLQQVFWNLISNAVKFTPRGGAVRVRAAWRDGRVEIAIADDGEGIAADFLPYVFDRFRQADGSTTRRHGGLGLGLAIVRHLVELHGGEVRAESDGPGRGATFTITLPVAAATTDAIDAAPPDSPPALRDDDALVHAQALAGCHVLVVDDDEDARHMVERVLSPTGARVTLAASAGEALAAIEADPPDLLVSDIGMQGVDGYELMRRIRARVDAPWHDVPSIALTAFARAEDRLRALRAGFHSYVAKPADPLELLTVAAGMVQWRRRRDD